MRFKTFALLIIVSMIVTTMVGAAPLEEKSIPIYGGAVADKAAQTQIDAEQQETPTGLLVGLGLTLRSKSIKVYACNAPAEAVFQFYLTKLGATHVQESVDPLYLKPGKTTPVDYDLSFHDLRDRFDSPSSLVIYPGKQIRRTLAANRKPYQPEKWVSWACFDWNVREKNGDFTGYQVIVSDRSFSPDYKTYKTRTWIEIHRQTYLSDEESEDEDEMDAQVAAKAKTMKQPTPKELGAPIYPGAVWQRELSAGMSLGDGEVFHLFFANDPPAKVAAFYEQKLGKKAAKNDGKYMIALTGTLPFPDEGIAIEPNNFGGKAKTVITFRKLLNN